MSLKLTLCQTSLLFLTCLSVICTLSQSDAAPATELSQLAADATSQSTDIASPSTKLKTIVQQAVSSSIQALGANATFTNDTTYQLVNDIVTNLLAAGVKTTPQCKPRSLEQLKQLFLANPLNRRGFSLQNNNSCLGLEKLSGFGEDVYYVSTSSSCPRANIRIDRVCYGSGNQSQCSMDTELQPITEDSDELENYFPRYKLQIMCRGCTSTDQHCLAERNNCHVNEKPSPVFQPLKRITGGCENGYEVWHPTKVTTAIVACSCTQS